MQSNLSLHFEGHAMTLTVAGLILFGTSVNYSDDRGQKKVSDALMLSNNAWLVELMNESPAMAAAFTVLDKIGEAATKRNWQYHAARFAAAFLEQHGGFTGLMAAKRVISGRMEADAINTLRDYDGEAARRPREAEHEQPRTGVKVVALDLSADNVKEQLESQGVPDALAAMLCGILREGRDEPVTGPREH